MPFYTSPSENENSPVVTQRSKRVKRVYLLEKTFKSRKRAIEAVEQEKIWSITTTNRNKVSYRCRLVKSRGKQCEASIYLQYHLDSFKVSLFRAKNLHTCSSSATKSTILVSDDVKLKIRDLYVNKFHTFSMILDELNSDEKIQPKPTKNQIRGIIDRIKREEKLTDTLSLSELDELAEKMTRIPRKNHKYFVISYNTQYEPVPKFHMLFTSRTLLANALSSDVLAADATYKCLFKGYPVIVVGTVDLCKKFHLIGIALASDETTETYEDIFKGIRTGVSQVFQKEYDPELLLSDAAQQIKMGFKNTFGQEKACRTCYFHVKKSVKQKLKEFFKTKVDRDQVLADLDILQKCPSEETFQVGYSLFRSKWEKKSQPFYSYFKKQWIDKNCDWYNGYGNFTLPKCPTTDNALERFNLTIKTHYTLRKKLLTRVFIRKVGKIIRDYSNRRINNNMDFSPEPVPSIASWQMAYNWVKLRKSIKSTNGSDGNKVYIVPAGDEETTAQVDLKENRKHHDFADFTKNGFKSYKVKLNPDNFLLSSCQCVSYFKEFHCKHTLGLSVIKKIAEFPKGAKKVKLDPKPKRGRPKNVSRALIVD